MVKVTYPVRIFPKIERGKLVGSITIDGIEVNTRMFSCEIVRRATVGIDTATISVVNNNNEFTESWEGGETVIIKADFSAGTTKIFEGYATNIKPSFNKFPSIDILCSGYGIRAFNNPVFKKYTTSTDLGQIFEDLISTYLPAFTTTNVTNPVGVTATPVWQGKDLFACLKDIATVYGSNNYDFFCDFNKDWHFFSKGSNSHGPTSQIAIVYGQNHRVTNLDDPFIKKRNKVTVIGKNFKGQVIMATKKDQSDIDKYWEMATIIRDTNLTTQDAVDNAASYHLSNLTTPGRSGNVTSAGLPGLLPGYNIMIFDPINKMNGYFTVSEVKHFMSRDFSTTSTIHEQLPRDMKLVELFGRMIEKDQQNMDIDNDDGMENSFVVTFDDSSQIDAASTSSNVGISNGRLVLTSGVAGNAVTTAVTAGSNITSIVLDINGSGYESCSFQVSVDNGNTWEDVTLRTLKTVSGVGKKLKYKILLKATPERSPGIESVGGRYK